MSAAASEKVFELVRAQIAKTKLEYLDRLDQRKQALHRRSRLYLGEQWLGYVPEGEYEVLILSGKLE
jgi:hypothetical protein